MTLRTGNRLCRISVMQASLAYRKPSESGNVDITAELRNAVVSFSRGWVGRRVCRGWIWFLGLY